LPSLSGRFHSPDRVHSLDDQRRLDGRGLLADVEGPATIATVSAQIRARAAAASATLRVSLALAAIRSCRVHTAADSHAAYTASYMSALAPT